MNRIKNSLIAFSGHPLQRAIMLVGLLAMCWLCAASALSQSRLDAGLLGEAADQSFFAPQSWARELTSDRGWGPDYPRMLADVNGDKRQDVVGFGIDGVWLATSTGTSFSPAFVLADFGYNSAWRVDKHVRTTGDINNDKMEDVVGFGDAGVYRALSTGTGFGEVTFVVANFGYDQAWRVDKHVRLLADVNGDGQKDIVAFGDAGVWLALATADGFFSEPAFVLAEFGSDKGWTPAEHLRTTADVNGDGKQDIVGFGYHGVWTALSTGDGFGPAQFVLAEFGLQSGWTVESHPRLLADIDGDGDQDIVGFGDAGVWTARAAGGGFEAAQFIIADFGTASGWQGDRHPRFVADLNGDGYQDIVGFGEEAVYRALGGPGGFDGIRMILRALVPEYFPYAPEFDPRFVGDVTGDGKHDLVAFDRSDIKVAASSDLPPPPPPAAPSNLRVTSKASTSLFLRWDDNSNDERRFFVTYGKAGSGITQTVTMAANVIGSSFSGLDPNTEYCFTIQAENIFGLSAALPFVCDRTTSEPPPPQSAFISAEIFPASPGSSLNHLRITGSGFQSQETVSLKITIKSQSGTLITVVNKRTKASLFGDIDFTYKGGVRGVCVGPPRRFEVQGTGLTSGKKSNVAKTGCPIE
ncbi:MAG TPA: FG-GAP-like repeat-containing protein [Blastocatellia bacterium]|nr:FG-GAP-like repeat-containing protein [Blastocatellia bacterium]